MRSHVDVGDACLQYAAATGREMRERYEFLTALDAERSRMWHGGEVDFAHHDGDYALFTFLAGGVAAPTDPFLARVFLRRIGLLDSTRVLDDDLALQLRIEAAFAEAVKVPRPRLGPSRQDMLATLTPPEP